MPWYGIYPAVPVEGVNTAVYTACGCGSPPTRTPLETYIWNSDPFYCIIFDPSGHPHLATSYTIHQSSPTGIPSVFSIRGAGTSSVTITTDIMLEVVFKWSPYPEYTILFEPGDEEDRSPCIPLKYNSRPRYFDFNVTIEAEWSGIRETINVIMRIVTNWSTRTWVLLEGLDTVYYNPENQEPLTNIEWIEYLTSNCLLRRC